MFALWADYISRNDLPETTILIYTGTSRAETSLHQQELPELTHTLRVRPWRRGITFHMDTLNERQKRSCITFSSVTTGLQPSAAGTLKAGYTDPTRAEGERVPWKLSSLPANNWADRIPQIAEHKSDDWIYYQPSSGLQDLNTASSMPHRLQRICKTCIAQSPP